MTSTTVAPQDAPTPLQNTPLQSTSLHGSTPHGSTPRESAVGGTARMLAAEALIIPSGLFVAALLARQLPLEDYGRFTLAITLVTWIEWSLTALFARSTIKLVSEADDPRAVSATVLRTYAVTSILAALVLAALAPGIGMLLGEPRLAPALWLLALDVPLFCLAQAHRNILIGMGRFSARASASAARWISRALLIAALVWAGLGVEGALLGAIGASLCELLVCRRAVQPAWKRSDYPAHALWQLALPLLGCALVLRLFDKLDLFMLTALSGTATSAALYGAAQNLALAPSIFALAFSPTLLAAVSRARRDGDALRARRQGRDALRAVLLLAPLAALVSAAAWEIVPLFYGERFAPAAPVFALLVWGATALAAISVCSSLLVAHDRPGWAFALVAPLLLLAPLGHWLAVPTLGMIGAAGVTTVLAVVCAATCFGAAQALCGVAFPAATAARAALTSLATWLVCNAIATPGAWLLLKLFAAAIAIIVLLAMLGEWEPRERAWIQSLLRPGVTLAAWLKRRTSPARD